MTMCTQDFTKVAEVIERNLTDIADHPEYADDKRAAAYQAVRLVAVDLALTFAEINPRFDRAVFLDACGVAS